MIPILPSLHPMPQGLAPDDGNVRSGQLRRKAEELETAFLSEMLGHAGLGAARAQFGGGIGEEQFSSFLRNEQAKAMVKTGGIGLAERLFQALTARQGEGGHVG